MGFKCGNCNVDYPNRAKLVTHMVLVHDSPFIDGDQELIDLSNKVTQAPEYQATQSIVSSLGAR